MSLIRVNGAVAVEVTDRNGKITFQRRTENLIVTTGDEHLADRMLISTAQPRMTCMGLGTNSTAATKANTELGGEISATRPGFSGAYTPSKDGATITFRSLWGPGHATSATIREVGIFNATAAGRMLARAVFTSPVNKGANDTLQVTWTMTVAGT